MGASLTLPLPLPLLHGFPPRLFPLAPWAHRQSLLAHGARRGAGSGGAGDSGTANTAALSDLQSSIHSLISAVVSAQVAPSGPLHSHAMLPQLPSLVTWVRAAQ
jgi:hypothetical protein